MEDQHHLGQWITVKRNKQDEDIKIDSLIEKKKKKKDYFWYTSKKKISHEVHIGMNKNEWTLLAQKSLWVSYMNRELSWSKNFAKV